MYMSDLSVVICTHFTVIVLGVCFCLCVCVYFQTEQRELIWPKLGHRPGTN